MRFGVLFAALGLCSTALAQTPMRREVAPQFVVDPAFQDRGGVQYFYSLLPADEGPETDPVFTLFRPFDGADRYRGLESPPHVVLSRLVYTVEKDVSFFSERRARDVDYINAVAKGMNVTARDDGSFRVGKMPSNTFRVRYFNGPEVERLQRELPGLKLLVDLSAQPTAPASVVFQENSDFSRVMGMRTAEASFTWTGHYAVAPGRTRVIVYTMSYLASLPPFFLGGPRRVFRESTEGARVLIDNLRAYED